MLKADWLKAGYMISILNADWLKAGHMIRLLNADGLTAGQIISLLLTAVLMICLLNADLFTSVT